MRVLHIIQRYWPATGGAERYMADISAQLAAAGHSVTIATTDALDFELFWDTRRQRIPESQSQHDRVRILRFPVRHLPASSLAYPAIRRLLWLLSMTPGVPAAVLARLARFTPWTPDLWRWLETTREQFDLVAGMTICFEPLLEAGLRFARTHGVPFVAYPLTHLGAGPQPAADALSRFYTMRHQIALVCASDAIVALTPTEAAFYESRGVSRSRLIVAGPGMDPDHLAGGDGARFRQRYGIVGPLVVSLSTMSYDKGSIHLVEAVRQLWQMGREVDLVMAGAILAPFRNYLSALPQADRQRIHVLGSISDQEKCDLLAAADLFAMPSRTESFGIVYLEAWLYRKPVIGAQTWSVKDVIANGRDGLLVPFGDVPALAQEISYLLDHPDERQAMGEAGYAKVRQQHTWDRTHTLVSDLYQRLIQAR